MKVDVSFLVKRKKKKKSVEKGRQKNYLGYILDFYGEQREI